MAASPIEGRRRVKSRLWVLIGAVVGASVLPIVAPAGAATTTTTTTTLPTSGQIGADISYPQCPPSGSYPSGQGLGFGIVGVNGGRPMVVNDCFGPELGWEKSLGATNSLQLYVNTADPGNTVSDWPTSGSTPYGPCTGSHGRGANSTACAYLYGQKEAIFDITQISNAGSIPGSFQWWLDVETANSWQSHRNLEMNQASLDGMLSVLPQGQVGVYSTSYQWGQIVGSSLDATSGAAGLGALPQWIPTGQGSLGTAQADCATLPRVTTGPLVYTQYTSGYDYDYAC